MLAAEARRKNVNFANGDSTPQASASDLSVVVEVDSKMVTSFATEGKPMQEGIADGAEVDDQISYTQQAVPMLAVPQEMPRPRGLFRQTSRIDGRGSQAHGEQEKGGAHNPTYIATRANTLTIHKSAWSRATYTIVLLNIILWTPPWLKLLTIRRIEHNDYVPSIYNFSIGMNLSVGFFGNVGRTTCSVCDTREQNDPGVTYPVSASLRHFHHADHVQAAAKVVLFASWDWDRWAVVSSPGLWTGLRRGDQTTEVCLGEPIPQEVEESNNVLLEDAALQARKQTTFAEQSRTSVTENNYYPSGGNKVDLSVTEQTTVRECVMLECGRRHIDNCAGLDDIQPNT